MSETDFIRGSGSPKGFKAKHSKTVTHLFMSVIKYRIFTPVQVQNLLSVRSFLTTVTVAARC